ncbi:MAG TPA: hypothetical protein VGD71_32105 [Kribbella sp.]|jgi:inosine-uridine nucleoside N-ribohydrolase
MKPVIVDFDTGPDDACALLLAARQPDLELKAVTCGELDIPLTMYGLDVFYDAEITLAKPTS